MATHPNCTIARSSSIPDHRQLLELLEKNKRQSRKMFKKPAKAVFSNQKYQIFTGAFAYTHPVTYYPQDV
jgi:hypothetical protein